MIQIFLSLLIIALTFAPAVLSQNLDSQTQTTQLEQLQEDYYFQLEKYRQARSEFTLTRAQAIKLGTLKSQEEFVASGKTLLLARSDVLESYLTSLSVSLAQTQGIDVDDKQIAQNLIELIKSKVQAHHQAVTNLSDRSELNSESLRFETEDLPLFIETSYRSLSLVTIGRLQKNSDQLIVSGKQFEQDTIAYEDDVAKKASFERGIKQVSQQIETSTISLDEARLAYAQFDILVDSGKSFNPRDIYQGIVKS